MNKNNAHTSTQACNHRQTDRKTYRHAHSVSEHRCTDRQTDRSSLNSTSYTKVHVPRDPAVPVVGVQYYNVKQMTVKRYGASTLCSFSGHHERFSHIVMKLVCSNTHRLFLLYGQKVLQRVITYPLHGDFEGRQTVPVPANGPNISSTKLIHHLDKCKHIWNPGSKNDVKIQHENIITIYDKLVGVNGCNTFPIPSNFRLNILTNIRNTLNHLKWTFNLSKILQFQ